MKNAQKTGGKMKLIPLGDRVLVRPYTEDELQKTASGIYIPDTVAKEKSEQGEVIAVGEGRYHDGKIIPMKIKVGDRVVFSKYGYEEVKVNGEDLYIFKEDNILGIVK